ncbi:hypothetical protein, partial [Klebsiella pneumoniae]|uniref:hypothetical protein n=1 Tax=Klebsiella pneumoniae TaxID=573 RepID=UPI001F4A4D50
TENHLSEAQNYMQLWRQNGEKMDIKASLKIYLMMELFLHFVAIIACNSAPRSGYFLSHILEMHPEQISSTPAGHCYCSLSRRRHIHVKKDSYHQRIIDHPFNVICRNIISS